MLADKNEDTAVKNFLKVIKSAYDQGILLIFAAGNLGPLADTMSIFGSLPWVLGVGAADWSGNYLAEFSSRGIPDDPIIKPDIVAPGIDVIVPWDCSKEKTFEQKINDEKVISLSEILKQTEISIEEDCLDEYIRTHTVLSGTSFASAIVTRLSAILFNLRKENNLSTDPDSMIRLFKDIAVPMPGYGQWEVGMGFVSDTILSNYIEDIKRGVFKSDESIRLWNK